MTDLREQLAEIIRENVLSTRNNDGMGVYRAADAIIEALPGMVQPLVWDKHPDEPEYFGGGQDEVTGVTPYYIGIGGKGRFYVEYRLHKIRDHNGKVVWHDTPAAAKAAVQAHHVATIMQAFGVQGGEA